MADTPMIPPPPPGAVPTTADDRLVIIPSPDHPDLALVLGGMEIPDMLGTVIAKAPEAALRTLQTAGALSQAVAVGGMATGRWVQLTADSAASLHAFGPSMNAAGTAMTGVLRGTGGHIAQHLEFSPGVLMDPTGATLIANLAVQATLARIEKQLESLADKVDLLLEHSRIEVESRLISSLETIRMQERRLAGLGVVDDDGWDALASVESDVRQAFHHVLRWLMPLRQLLTVEDARVPQLVADLEKSVELRDVATWIRLYVWAELAMKRWELLYLVRQMTVAPQLVAPEAEHLQREAAARHAALTELYTDLTTFLDRDPDDVDWRDRARLINRYRLGVLRREVAKVVNIYAEALQQAQVEVPAYLDPRGDAGTGPLLRVEDTQRRLLRGAAGAIEAGKDVGEDVVGWLGDRGRSVKREVPELGSKLQGLLGKRGDRGHRTRPEAGDERDS